MFFKKKGIINTEYMSLVRQATEELRQGKQSCLSVLYQALATDNVEILNLASSGIAKYIQGLNSNQIIRLDECFREYSSMEWTISWDKINLNIWERNIKNIDEYLWILRLGTFHPNGYFR